MPHHRSRLRAAVALAAGALWATAAGPAQDLDRVLYEGETVLRALTDPMEDPQEREAFEKLWNSVDPVEKRRLAEEFLRRYPRSWMTSSAHEAAAKASIDLHDLTAALEHGQESLGILPENPALQVSVANVLVHAGRLEAAEDGASDALEYLGRFRHPAAYSSRQWEQIARELRGSAEYVLGRVLATRGLQSAQPGRLGTLASARQRLLEATRLNPRDGIALVLLGMVSDELGADDEALRAYGAAARQAGPARGRALEWLERRRREGPAAGQPLEAFLRDIGPLRRTRGDPSEREADPGRGASPLYAGSDACAECHEEVAEAWAGTGMAKMFRPYRRENVIGDFTLDNEVRDESGQLVWRALLDDDGHYFEMPAPGGHRRYRVHYTIGSKWQQAYATRLSDGRIQVVPVQYNALHGTWVNFWEILDGGPSERSSVAGFHRMRASTNYQVHCASCHTSQVQAEGALVVPDRITFRETGVNCEMCHGPARQHVEAMREGRPDHDAGSHLVRFGEIGHRKYVAICGQCHMQSGVVEIGSRGELNYPDDPGDFPPIRLQRPYGEFSREAFYKDGRFRETTFIVESFMRSECFRQGQAQCGHCHDPHPSDSATNPTSLKFRDDRNGMCLQCHESLSGDIEAHTRHTTGSAGSQCEACHMPAIMNSMMFNAGTHRIDDIPDAAMTERFGPEDSPNACLGCHQDRGLPWVAERLANW